MEPPCLAFFPSPHAFYPNEGCPEGNTDPKPPPSLFLQEAQHPRHPPSPPQGPPPRLQPTEVPAVLPSLLGALQGSTRLCGAGGVFGGKGGSGCGSPGCMEVPGAERVPPLPLCPALQGAQQRPQPLCILKEIIPGWQEREVGVLGWGHGGGERTPAPLGAAVGAQDPPPGPQIPSRGCSCRRDSADSRSSAASSSSSPQKRPSGER